jgi:hypothetical protein
LYILGGNRHKNYLHWKVTQQDLIIASIKRTIQLAVMQTPLARGHVLMEWPLEKQPPLFRGHIQTQWPLWKTCNKGTVETCFDATTSIQRTPWTDNYNLSGTGRWNYLDLDKLKHRKLSLVCLGFTSMNVPPMLKCPGSSAFRHNQMSGVTFGGHVPWVLCSVPWLGGSGEGTGVRSYTGVLYSGCRDPLSWTTTQV